VVIPVTQGGAYARFIKIVFARLALWQHFNGAFTLIAERAGIAAKRTHRLPRMCVATAWPSFAGGPFFMKNYT
jgi:hypothetical protein